jgi:hypothetical protein
MRFGEVILQIKSTPILVEVLLVWVFSLPAMYLTKSLTFEFYQYPQFCQ